MVLKTAVYVGHARAPAHSVTGQTCRIIQVVMEVDKATGDIVAADVNLVSIVSRRYVVRMLVGRSLMGELGIIVEDIERDYHSASQKAVVQALNDLYQQYMADRLKLMSSPFGDV